MKLEAARRADYDKAITFEFSHFMSPQSAYLQAGHLYNRYKEYFTSSKHAKCTITMNSTVNLHYLIFLSVVAALGGSFLVTMLQSLSGTISQADIHAFTLDEIQVGWFVRLVH